MGRGGGGASEEEAAAWQRPDGGGLAAGEPRRPTRLEGPDVRLPTCLRGAAGGTRLLLPLLRCGGCRGELRADSGLCSGCLFDCMRCCRLHFSHPAAVMLRRGPRLEDGQASEPLATAAVTT